MATDTEIKIRLATPEDRLPIIYFMRKFFFRDEPLSKALQIVTNENPINKDWERFAFFFYDQGFNLVAEYNGKIIAVILNGIMDRDTPLTKFVATPGDKFSVIADLVNILMDEVDCFELYPDVDKIMMILEISVDKNFRQKGISKKLLEKTLELAKEQKVGLVSIECTSYYSSAAVKSLGFKEIYSLNYDDFKQNGEVRIKPASPHTAISILVLKM